MIYNDLLTVPFLRGGRSTDGMDCYGFVIECLRREGKELKDIAATPDGDLVEYVSSLNVSPTDTPKPGSVVQFIIPKASKENPDDVHMELHVGYMLDKRTCLHMTHKGIRRTPLIALKNPSFFEVTE